MALRTIVEIGDPVLNKKCRKVTEFNERIWQLLDDMHETLVDANGLGLAAPQVGILRSICLVAEELEDGTLKYYELINPEIFDKEGSITLYEGCLSVPGRNGAVDRPEKLKVTAQDRNGKTFTMEAEGMLARAICHETDHLNGVTILDLATDFLEDHLDEEGNIIDSDIDTDTDTDTAE